MQNEGGVHKIGLCGRFDHILQLLLLFFCQIICTALKLITAPSAIKSIDLLTAFLTILTTLRALKLRMHACMRAAQKYGKTGGISLCDSNILQYLLYFWTRFSYIWRLVRRSLCLLISWKLMTYLSSEIKTEIVALVQTCLSIGWIVFVRPCWKVIVYDVDIFPPCSPTTPVGLNHYTCSSLWKIISQSINIGSYQLWLCLGSSRLRAARRARRDQDPPNSLLI